MEVRYIDKGDASSCIKGKIYVVIAVENTLSGNTKGGLYECAVADALYKNGHSLCYYKNETTRKEIDFLIEKEGKIAAIEVKSSNTRATSLNDTVLKTRDVEYAYKFIDGNVGIGENGVVSLPLYMAMFITNGGITRPR